MLRFSRICREDAREPALLQRVVGERNRLPMPAWFDLAAWTRAGGTGPIPCPKCQQPITQIRAIRAHGIEYVHDAAPCREWFLRTETRDRILRQVRPARWEDLAATH